MFVKKNKKNRTWFVGHRNPKNVELFYSVSFRNAKRGSKLTIRIDGKRMDLNGRQVALLNKVLKIGNQYKYWNINVGK
jgi:hypothetical protein